MLIVDLIFKMEKRNEVLSHISKNVDTNFVLQLKVLELFFYLVIYQMIG